MTERENGRVYLWLNCEGWVRFGPFAWLRLDDERGAILDDSGDPIAVRTEDGWTTPENHEGFQWRNPMITASGRHPHPNQGSISFRLRRPTCNQPDRQVEASALAGYLCGSFVERLATLRTQRPNEIVLQKIMEDPDAVFFGGRDWERCWEDLFAVPDEERARFVLCLFVLVLLDQHTFTSYRPLHAAFRDRHHMPKFGWSGFGPHNENPFKLVVVPVREGLIRLDDLAAVAGEAMALLAEDVTAMLEGTGVPAADYFRRLYADRGFAEFGGDPARDAVVAALDAVLAKRNIHPR
jgi:hypothetical protein